MYASNINGEQHVHCIILRLIILGLDTIDYCLQRQSLWLEIVDMNVTAELYPLKDSLEVLSILRGYVETLQNPGSPNDTIMGVL